MSRLRIAGEVANPVELSWSDLREFPEEFQIRDVSRFDPKRRGDAISLRGLIARVQPPPSATYLGLHAARDNFHASIPLEPILDTAFLIYSVDGQALDDKAGGPFRFYIPNHHACHTHEIDECANVKFVDLMEFSREKGFDNRPHDAREHADLHREE